MQSTINSEDIVELLGVRYLTSVCEEDGMILLQRCEMQ